MTIISTVRRIRNPTGSLEILSSSFYSISTVASPPSTADPLISEAVSVLTHHRSKSRWSALRSLSPASGFTPTQFSEITLQIRNNPHLAIRFFLFTRRHSLCSHDVVSCCTLIHVLARSRVLKRHARDITRLAVQIAREDLAGSSLENESDCLLRVFRCLCKTYNRCGSAPFVFDLLMKSCLDSKKIDGSILIMRKLKSRGISPQIGTCNALISEVCRRSGASTGYELYKELWGMDEESEKPVKCLKVKPNCQIFNSLMVCFHREGEMEKVEEIWREMEELGCSPNAYSYSVLLDVYFERGFAIKAKKLWEEMRAKGLNQDVAAYNTFMGGLCRIGEVVEAEKIFQEMELNGIESTSASYEHLIHGYSKSRDIDSALLLYNAMRKKGFKPENSTIDRLIKGLCNESRVSEAVELMKVATRDLGFCPKAKSYELAIKGLCEEGKMDDALKIQAEMVGRGFEPNSKIYTAFIDGYTKAGDEEMAVSLRKEMFEWLNSQEMDKESDLTIQDLVCEP